MDMIKIGTRLPQGLLLRIGKIFSGPEGEEQVREIGMHAIPGSGSHLGYAPGNLHASADFVPYAEIPADHWHQWCEMNEGSDLLTSGALFEHDGREPKAPKPMAPVEPKPAGPVGVPGGDVADDPAPATVKPESQMSESELEHATRP